MLIRIVFPLVALALVSCAPSAGEQQSFDRVEGVANGKLLHTGDFPASRSLVIVQTTLGGKPAGFCTGVIIAPNVGITAGHCFDQADKKSDGFNVIFDISQWGARNRFRLGKTYRIHPFFGANPEVLTFNFGNGQQKKVTLNMRNDIAVFSFYGDIPEGAKAAHVYSDTQTDLSNSTVYIYGAGHSRYMSEKTYDGTHYNQGIFGWLRRGRAFVNTNYTQYPEFYFTSPTSEAMTCRGDSGGPQFIANAKEPTVVGINSAMIVNDVDGTNIDSLCGHTAVTTKVAPFATWIAQKTAELQLELKQ